MSTPDQPETPQLTRRQLREIRNTASTPIITPDMQRPDPGETPGTDAEATAPEQTPPPAAAPVAPLPRAAVPVDIPEAPIADSAVDLGGHALTRRAARQQERLRTAAIAVQPPAAPVEEAPSDAAGEQEHVEELIAERDVTPDDTGSTGPVTAVIEAEPAADEAEPAADEAELAVEEAASDAEVHAEPPLEAGAEAAEAAEAESDTAAETESETTVDDGAEPAARPDDTQPDAAADAAHEPPAADEADAPHEPAAPGASFGLGRTEEPAEIDIEIALPPSFDQTLPRGGNGGASLSTANALILSQTPETGSLVSPVAATGEVLITGTFALPDTYGSTGRVPGSADGKDVDAVLLDGELPSASSPTPIAASAAVSTIKSAEDIIRPPAPEKGSKLMMALAITAGALALALAGVLILAFMTGVL